MKKLLLTLTVGGLLASSTAFAQVPPRPDRPPQPPEVVIQDPALKALIESFRTEEKALREELRTALGALTDPTREAIKAATDAFRAENAERIAAQKALAEEIKAAIQAARPDRPRPELPPEVVAALQDFRDAQEALRDAQRALREALKDATAAEKEIILAEFRAAQKTRIEELKAAQQALNETRGNGAGGTRR